MDKHYTMAERYLDKLYMEGKRFGCQYAADELRKLSKAEQSKLIGQLLLEEKYPSYIEISGDSKLFYDAVGQYMITLDREEGDMILYYLSEIMFRHFRHKIELMLMGKDKEEKLARANEDLIHQ